MSPLVSVVIPCFNSAKYLSETLESVKGQTFRNWECLLVDDGSTDATQSIAERACASDRRFKYFKKQNGGPSSARNLGMRNARGDYFLPWDADDLFDPSFVQKAVAILDSCASVGFVSCHVEMFGVGRWIVSDQKSGGVEHYIFWNNTVACALLRRQVWEDVGGYDETILEGYEDWDFWLAATRKGWRCHIIEEALFKYRRRPGSRYNSSETKRVDFVRCLVQKHKAAFCEHVEQAICSREELICQRATEIAAMRCSPEYRIGKLLLLPWRVGCRILRRRQAKAK